MQQRTSRLLGSGLGTIAILLSWGFLTPESSQVADPTPGSAVGKTIDVVFVLDNSGSMRENDPQFLTRTAVTNFAAALTENPEIDGRIAIVLFDGQARVIRDLAEIKSDEQKARFLDALGQLDFSGQRRDPCGLDLRKRRHALGESVDRSRRGSGPPHRPLVV